MRPWDSDAKDILWLLTLEELHNLPTGTKLTSIGGETIYYDPDNPPDLDTRYDVIAWGLINQRVEFTL